jgi:aminopeptidase N
MTRPTAPPRLLLALAFSSCVACVVRVKVVPPEESGASPSSVEAASTRAPERGEGRAAEASARSEAPAPKILRSDWEDAERARAFDLQHLLFEVDFDLEGRRIEAVATNLVRAFRDGLTEVSFDAEGLDVRSASVDGVETTFRTEAKKIAVSLPEPTRAGKDLSVRIAYSGQPRRGLHWVGPEPGYPEKSWQVWSQGQAEDHHFWIPTWDFPNDRATWECRLTCLEGLSAVSNGVLVGEGPGPRPGTRTSHWKMGQPNATYLIAVAVGPWERYADDWRGKPVEYWVDRGVGEATARRAFGQTPDMLSFFSDRIGVPYPWPRYAQVAVAEFVVGGMENVSCTLQTDRTLRDKRAMLDDDSEGLVAHELAHQWWGDYLTCRDWSHLWLNEGFATYFQVLYAGHARGVDEGRLEMRGQHRAYLGAARRGPARPMVADFFSRARPGEDSSHVYSKGSSVLHMLRFVLGDDLFWKAIGHYARKHALSNVDTRDFQRAVAEATGDPLEWFFEQWAYLAGHPVFEVEASWDEGRKTETLAVRQVQEAGGLVPIFRTPVDVKFVVKGRKEVRRIWIHEAEHRFEFPFETRPSLVRFDDGNWIVKELRFEKPIEEWIFQLERDDDVTGRIEAAEALGKRTSDPRAAEALARQLESADHRAVRVAAADALGEHRESARAKEALLARLSDPEARVRAACARALAGFGTDERIASEMRRVMRTDDSYRARANAAATLAKTGGVAAWDDLVSALSIPSHQDVVAAAAIRALADLDGERALPNLLEHAAYGKPYEVRFPAMEAIARIAPKTIEENRLAIRTVLEKGLDDRYFRARSAAIRGLGEIGDPAVRPRLESIAASDLDDRDRRAAERAIERLAALEKEKGKETGIGKGEPVPAAAPVGSR